MRLRPLSTMADTLGVSDPRAIRRRLNALGCPAQKVAGRWVVDIDKLERVALAHPTSPGSSVRGGTITPKGTRLWE